MLPVLYLGVKPFLTGGQFAGAREQDLELRHRQY
jgi:hypothetical protein